MAVVVACVVVEELEVDAKQLTSSSFSSISFFFFDEHFSLSPGGIKAETQITDHAYCVDLK